MSAGADPVVRGCGTRVAGGIYAETKSDPNGDPFEFFLFCPPREIDPKALGITPAGTKLVQIGNSWHIIDWVGSEHYPNPADFIEEARRFGVSRRIAKTTDFSKLGPESRILLVHTRAGIVDPETYQADRVPYQPVGRPQPWCPKGAKHDGPACVGLLWESLVNAEPARNSDDGQPHPRTAIRTLPSLDYWGAVPPTNAMKTRPALFAAVPLGRLVVVKGPGSEEAMERIGKASVETAEVDA